MKEYLQLLKQKDFFLLWIGQGVSDVGSKLHSIVLIWLVIERTGSAKSISFLFILMILPAVVIGPLAGAYVESKPKKPFIVGTDIIRGLLAIAIALADSLPAIYTFSLLSATAGVFFSPAIRTAIPRLVRSEELVTANAMTSFTTYSAMLIGPALAGLILAAFGAKAAFILNGISFLFSAFTELFIQIPGSFSESKQDHPSMWRDIKIGWQYIRETPVIQFVILFFAAAMIFFSFTYVLQTVLLIEVFALTAGEYGFVMTLYGVGLVTGTVFMGKWGNNFHELSSMLKSVALLGIGYFILPFHPSLYYAATVFFTLGFLATISNISYVTYLQKSVEDSFRARVFSMDIAISEITGLCAMAAAGFLGEIFGVAKVIAISGLCLLIIGIFFIRQPVYQNTVYDTKNKRTSPCFPGRT